YLVVDFKGFRTAVENLVRNAFQWARSFVRVTVKKKNDWMEIAVEDDGPGVKPEESNRVFEPFYSRRQGGTGLGLSIVRKFAIENGGFVYVVDSPLGGAKFVLKLPVERNGNEGLNSGR
ncbi:MAG: ATP-binding protein, partial [Desulfurobacteriaceae bacterium]